MGNGRHRHAVYRLRGDRIDRILARAGDKVTCQAGELGSMANLRHGCR